jgi:hypothetical protein
MSEARVRGGTRASPRRNAGLLSLVLWSRNGAMRRLGTTEASKWEGSGYGKGHER